MFRVAEVNLEMVQEGIGLMWGALVITVGLVFVALRAMSLYTISKRRGIANPWLSWLPFGQEWILGSISDQYIRAEWYRRKKRRWTLLILEMILIAMYLWYGFIFERYTVLDVDYSSGKPFYTIDANSPGIPFKLGCIILIIVTVIYYFICLNHIYYSCNPKNHSTFLALSLVLWPAQPILLFLDRKKDLGMPIRWCRSREMAEGETEEEVEPEASTGQTGKTNLPGAEEEPQGRQDQEDC